MAKDPRFNFYPDNYEGGTDGFTLEQHGAYMKLIIVQSRVGRFTEEQAMDKLIRECRGSTETAQKLWVFLRAKLATDGEKFWSERLEKEIAKSRRHSENQSERAKKRYSKEKEKKDSQPGTHFGSAAALPDNRTGIGNGIGKENKKESPDFALPDIPGDDLTFPIDTEPMRKLWAAWKEARWRNHSVRYPQGGEQADLRRMQGMNFHQVEETIQQAIAGGWKNLYPERNGTRQTPKPGKETPADLAAKLAERMHRTSGKSP